MSASWSCRKYPGRKIAVAAVADDRYDHRLFDFARDPQRRPQRAARRDAGEYALFARESACGLLGVGLRHLYHAVDPALVVDLRQVGLRPLADAGDLRALR